MNLIDVLTVLEDEGYGRIGASLFLSNMPLEISEGVMVRNPLTGVKIDHELPGYFKTTFQLIIRGKDLPIAMAKADEISKLLTMYETELDTMHVNYMRPQTKPIPYPITKSNLIEVTANFEVCFVEK